MQKFYLENDTDIIIAAENKYHYLPAETSSRAKEYSLNNLCYTKTRAIAEARQKQIETASLEQLLSDYRNYAQQFIQEK